MITVIISGIKKDDNEDAHYNVIFINNMMVEMAK
jgi:hypothetical protein